MANTKFSLVLRMCRENAGLTQKQVAEALGIERSTYAYYETGASHPSGLRIMKIANILGVDYKLFMDAIFDHQFDESPEDLRYTTLEDSSNEKRERLYTLKNREQTLIVNYRSLTEEQKQTIDDMINKMKKENFEKARSARKKKTADGTKRSSKGSTDDKKK